MPIPHIVFSTREGLGYSLVLGLEPAPGGLYLGAGSKLDAGSFWSGLIDDVRIYSRVVKP